MHVAKPREPIDLGVPHRRVPRRRRLTPARLERRREPTRIGQIPLALCGEVGGDTNLDLGVLRDRRVLTFTYEIR